MLIGEFRRFFSIPRLSISTKIFIYVPGFSISQGKLVGKLQVIHSIGVALPFYITDFIRYFEFLFFTEMFLKWLKLYLDCLPSGSVCVEPGVASKEK